MTIEWFRDLVIIIFCLLGIGATLLITIVALVIFRRVGSVLNTTKAVVEDMSGTTYFLSDTFVKPFIGAASFVSGVRQALRIVSRLSQRKGDGRHG